MSQHQSPKLVSLDCSASIWERFFTVAPLVLVGTTDEDGALDFAPKHMAMPMGWENYYGFVCTPRHGTYANILRTGVFTVTYPRPSQLLLTSLAASPRCDKNATKPVLQAFDTFPAGVVEGHFLADGQVFLECEKHSIIDGFGVNSLIIGQVRAAHVSRDALRDAERDDQDLIYSEPLLAYVHPWRYTTIANTDGFPTPEGMKR